MPQAVALSNIAVSGSIQPSLPDTGSPKGPVTLKAAGATRTTSSSCITQQIVHYAVHMSMMVACISRRDRRRSQGTLLASEVGAESFVSLASGSRAHDVEQAITPQGQLWGVCFRGGRKSGRR